MELCKETGLRMEQKCGLSRMIQKRFWGSLNNGQSDLCRSTAVEPLEPLLTHLVTFYENDILTFLLRSLNTLARLRFSASNFNH
jgi:hypothetical protein